MGEDDLGNLESIQTAVNQLRIEDYDYEGRGGVDIYDDEYSSGSFSKGASVDVPTGVLSGAWSRIGGSGT